MLLEQDRQRQFLIWQQHELGIMPFLLNLPESSSFLHFLNIAIAFSVVILDSFVL